MSAPVPIREPLPEPLRLPRGSVRGLLAMLLMGTFGFLLIRDANAPAVLVNATVVVLSFYFGTRGPSPVAAAPAEALPPRWRQPKVVRALLVLGFVGLAAWFLRGNVSLSSLPAPLLQVLEVLAGFVLGLALSWVVHRRAHESPMRRQVALVFRDVSAAGALGLTAFACFAFATGTLAAFSSYVEQALSLVITYYFGSRVLAH